MEGHVEQHEDDEEDDRDQYLQSFLRAYLELVLPGPPQRVSRRQLEPVTERRPGAVHIPSDVGSCRINIDVARQLPVFVPNHRGARRESNLGQLAERDVRPHRRTDQHALVRGEILSERPGIATFTGYRSRPSIVRVTFWPPRAAWITSCTASMVKP